MNNGETNTRDTRVVDAYRAASDALDELPSAQSRAAILAAAARAVEARPADAASGATSKRPRARMSAIAPSRRPLALVASFLVATIAIVIATQTDEQHGTNPSALVASREPSQVAAATAAKIEKGTMADADLAAKREAPGPATSPATPSVAAVDKLDTTRQAEAKLARKQLQAAAPAASKPATPEPQPAARDERAPADTSDERAREIKSAEAGQATSTESRVGPPSPPAVGALATAPPSAAPVEERSKENAYSMAPGARRADRAPAETDAAVPAKLAKARPVERTVALAEGVVEVENDPARWMERIIALRDAGRDEDADRELLRLRARYTDFKIPPNALRRTGTR